MTTTARHLPVMCERVVDLLAPALARPGALLVDATLGLGGHAAMVLERCPQARLLGIDRDAEALAVARQRLQIFGDRVTTVQAVYDELARVLADRGSKYCDAILLDLGLSSLQIDAVERGFAYASDAPLDMRMSGDDQELTAATVVNTYSEAALARLLRVYGDERFSHRIAAAIVAARATPLTRSGQLVDIVTAAIPVAARLSGGHPAKRTFQALRIEVNRERDALVAVLPVALSSLALGGRIVVLSYHSGEDRLVKRALTTAASDAVPSGLVEVPDHHRAQFRLLTAGAEKPCAAELAGNPRSASARLRAAERIKEAK